MTNSVGEAQTAVKHGTKALNKLRDEAVNAATDLASEFRESAAGLAESARDQITELVPRATEAIRNRPWPVLGLALGIGCVLGMIVSRRR
jgi:ElaB/YqjD/DUF883 family membrane-anchored ribosome-binding protein